MAEKPVNVQMVSVNTGIVMKPAPPPRIPKIVEKQIDVKIVNEPGSRLDKLAAEIQDLAAKAEKHTKIGLTAMRDCGQKLIEARKLCEHGQWLPWLKQNFGKSERTARSYIELAKRWKYIKPDNNGNAAVFSLRQVAQLFQDTQAKKPKPKQVEPTIEEYTEDIAGKVDSFCRGDDVSKGLDAIEEYSEHVPEVQKKRIAKIATQAAERLAKVAGRFDADSEEDKPKHKGYRSQVVKLPSGGVIDGQRSKACDAAANLLDCAKTTLSRLGKTNPFGAAAYNEVIRTLRSWRDEKYSDTVNYSFGEGEETLD